MQAAGRVTSRGMRIVPRDGQNGSLSTSTIIIIAVVCGCVLILVLSLFLWRLLIRYLKPKNSVPLPPKQDLAHHREQQLAAFEASRPTTSWLGDTFSLSGRGGSIGPTSSNVSLLTATPERKASYYLDDANTAESTSELPSPLSNEDFILHAPNRTFVVSSSPHTSMTSMASIPEVAGPTTDYSSPTLSPSDTTSSHSHVTPMASRQFSMHRGSNSPSPTPARRSQSNTRSLSRPRSRPTSMASFAPTAHSGHTQRSASTLRGAPHGPFSSVQIVLPTPLAPQLFPYGHPPAEGTAIGPSEEMLPTRSSVFVDQWINVGSSQSSNQPQENGERRQRRASSSKPSKHQTSASESYQNGAANNHRRSSSQPRLSSDRKPSSLSISSVPASPSAYQAPPPVPRIPSVYETSSQLAESEERGRSRTSRSDSISRFPLQNP